MSKTSSVRLVIKIAEITSEGILIRSMEIINTDTGETIKIAKLTPELLDYLKTKRTFEASELYHKKKIKLYWLKNIFNFTIISTKKLIEKERYEQNYNS